MQVRPIRAAREASPGGNVQHTHTTKVKQMAHTCTHSEWSYPGLRGSGGPLPCSFFTSISLLLIRTSRSLLREPLRRRAPLPS